MTAAPNALFSAAPWVTNGTTISYGAGNVGVGTTSPSARLNALTADVEAVAIRGDAPNGISVLGASSGNGFSAVAGNTSASTGYGVYGYNSSSSNYGMLATGNEGVYAWSSSFGVNGQSSGGTGVNGVGYNGMWGASNFTDGNGVRGECDTGSNAYGVWGLSSSGWAGTFSGKVQVTGNFYAGAKFFRIDDPIDPENKMLIHACVESSEMKDMYDGTATLDGTGEAWVELPAWFESLNGDFRYQLTCIGAPAQVYIKQKVLGNRFLIAGGQPGMEVSWQVTGVRQDPYAKANPMQVEVEKEGADRGKYLHPEVYGLPESRSIGYEKLAATQPNPTAPRPPAVTGAK